MNCGPKAITRRAQLAKSTALSATLLGASSACNIGQSQPTIVGPNEVSWSQNQEMGEPRWSLWTQTLAMAEQATGIKVNLVAEPGTAVWTKRQAEFAAASPAVDVMFNQLNWVLPGGLNGMFVDHNQYMRRDKVDAKQYYKADLDSGPGKASYGAFRLRAVEKWSITTRSSSTRAVSSTRRKTGPARICWTSADA